MSDNPELKFIMEKTGPGNTPADFTLYACRGEGRGCPRNRYRTRAVHCDDCVPADNPQETIGDFQARLLRGHS